MYTIKINSDIERAILLEALKDIELFKRACAGPNSKDLIEQSETARKLRNRIMKATR